MSIVLIGNTPLANVLITDAMVTTKEHTESYYDCGLKDKISTISNEGYVAILGDENILFGIQILNNWAVNKNVEIDFSDHEYMRHSLTVAYRLKQLQIGNGYQQLPSPKSTVYFMYRNRIFTYSITYENDSFCIRYFKTFEEGELILNYAGSIENVSLTGEPCEYFEKAIQIVNNKHEQLKIESNRVGRRLNLEYDFDNRFCGVLLKTDSPPIFRSPFNFLSDYIASQFDKWDLIENTEYQWNPF